MREPTMPDLRAGFAVGELLPDDLGRANPFAILKGWLDAAVAAGRTPNPNAMTVATVDGRGMPSSRVVLVRGVEVERGYLVFFTNRLSRKGRELDGSGVAAATLHFDHFDRQVRVEARAVRSPDSESDGYFAGRGTAKAIAAWSSDQSSPIGSRREMLEKVDAVMARFGVRDGDESARIPRPPHWGGYRLWAHTVELWVGSVSRMHDRAVWRRELGEVVRGADGADGFSPGAWGATRLQP